MLLFVQLQYLILNQLKKNKNKIKKDQNNLNLLKLEKNKDILEYLGKNNKHRPKLVVGFSAETENLNKKFNN